MHYEELIDKNILLQFSIDLDEDLKMSLNKIWWGVHWWVRSTFRNIWHEEIYDIIKRNWIELIKSQIHIEYEYRFKTRYLDTSNCAVMNKAIEDWLVESGALTDDTPQYIVSACTYVPIIEQSERRKMDYDKLIITIYDIGMIPLNMKGTVIREKAKGKKRTTYWGKSEKDWEVVKKLEHMK